jgi:hypothetical protein
MPVLLNHQRLGHCQVPQGSLMLWRRADTLDPRFVPQAQRQESTKPSVQNLTDALTLLVAGTEIFFEVGRSKHSSVPYQESCKPPRGQASLSVARRSLVALARALC